MKYSACIEWLFAPESPDFANRIRLARDAGLDAVEFWKWTEKDIPAVEKALAETKLALSSLVAEPMIPLTDPASHDAFLVGLRASAEMANRLGAKVLIAQAGDDLPGRTRAEQHQALVDCLTQAADVLAGTGVVLGLEPLNTLIDHKGYFLHSTVENRVLKIAPGYSLIKETVVQILGSSRKSLFSSVALVQLFGNETLASAFITDRHADGSYTVFVPTGPNPTSGNIFHLKAEYVHPVNVPIEDAIRSIISCGAGSSKLIEAHRAAHDR